MPEQTKQSQPDTEFRNNVADCTPKMALPATLYFELNAYDVRCSLINRAAECSPAM
jgi:hypothetical protein